MASELRATIITQEGLDLIHEAATSGVYATIRYFLPIYDHRVDDVVHSTYGSGKQTEVSALSALEDINTTRSTIYGEKLWNNLGTSAAYSLTPESWLYVNNPAAWDNTNKRVRYYPAGNGSGETQESTAPVNLLNGTPLSHTVSGDVITWIEDTGSPPGYWDASGPPIGAFVSGLDPLGTNELVPSATDDWFNKLYPVYSYTPLTSGSTDVRGLYKCKLDSRWGNFKFNKVALYAIKLNADYTVNTSALPALVAIADFDSTAIYKTGQNISHFEANFEVKLTSSETSISALAYYTGDGWNRTPDISATGAVSGTPTLHWDGYVGIRTFSDGVNNESAQRPLHVMRDSEGWAIRMGQSTSAYIDLGVSANRIGGSDYMELIPKIDNTIESILFASRVNLGAYQRGGFYRKFNSVNAFNFNIYGTSTSADFILGALRNSSPVYNAYGIQPSIYLYECSGSNNNASIVGGDVWRQDNSIIIGTSNYGQKTDVGVNDDVYIVAGFDPSQYSVGGNQTHFNYVSDFSDNNINQNNIRRGKLDGRAGAMVKMIAGGGFDFRVFNTDYLSSVDKNTYGNVYRFHTHNYLTLDGSTQYGDSILGFSMYQQPHQQTDSVGSLCLCPGTPEIGFSWNGEELFMGFHFVPVDITPEEGQTIGSESRYWRRAYIGQIDTNQIYASFIGDSSNKVSELWVEYASIDTLDGSFAEGFVPVGTIIMWYNNLGQTPPNGWKKCDGNTFDETEYPILYEHLGSNALPNLQGRFPVGIGTGGGATYNQAGNFVDSNSAEGEISVTLRSGNGKLTGIGTSPTGGGQAYENRPPFWVCTYLIRAY